MLWIFSFLFLSIWYTNQSNAQDQLTNELDAIKVFDESYAEPKAFEKRLEEIKAKYPVLRNSCPYNYLFNKKAGAYYFSVADDNARALQLQQKVLAQQLECPETEGSALAITYFNIAQAHLYMGAFDKAEENFDKVIETELSLNKSHDATSHHYTWIGEYYFVNGDVAKALSYYERAKQNYNGDQSDYRYRDLMQKTAQAHLRAGEYKQAISNLKKALEITRRLSNEHPLVEVDVLTYLWEAHHNQKLYDQAENYIQQAIDISKNNNLQQSQIKVMGYLSNTRKARGDYEAAESLLYEVKNIITSMENPSFQIISGNNEEFGDVYYERGDYRKAISYYQNGLKTIDSKLSDNLLQNPTIETKLFPDETYLKRQLGLKAKALKALGEKDKDVELLASTIDAIKKYDTLNRRLLLKDWDEQSHLSLLEETRATYQIGIEAAITAYRQSEDQSYQAAAYDLVSRLKAQLLSRGIDLEKKKKEILSDSILQLEKKHKDSIRILSERYLASVDGDKQELDAAQKAFYNESLRLNLFRKKNGIDKLLDQSDFIKIPALKKIQSSLDREEALLEFHMHENSLLSFVITKSNIRFFESNLSKDLILDTYKSLSTSSAKNKNLFSADFLDHLMQMPEKSLTIIPDQYLTQLPYEALMLSEEKRWIDKFEIHYEYGITFIDKARTPSKLSYVGFASDYNPERFVSYSDIAQLESLDYTLDEVNSAKDILNGELYLNTTATKKQLEQLTSASTPSILHFAMHGQLDPQFPDRSALIFEAKDGDHELSAAEIYDLSIPSALTILSACNSGTGRVEVGDGVRSLTRSFIHAGSNSVITSLWEASDGSTSKILNSFFSYIKEGKSKSAALRMAKLDYLDGATPTYQAPKYWAHLVLVGDAGGMVGKIYYGYYFIGFCFAILFILLIFKKDRR